MVVMKFSKGGKALSFTAMQMGPKVNVSADGSGLVMAAAKSDTAAGQASSASAAKVAAGRISKPKPDSALPVPKQRTMRMMGTGKMPGSDAPFRRDLEASVPADLNAVLAFYRSELGKRGWKETAERAVIKPDQVKLAFSSSDGPAVLKLGRSNGETSINLAQKYPAAAAKANVIPKPGQAQAGVRQYGRQRSVAEHQQADHQDRRRRRRTAIAGSADARSARRANTPIRSRSRAARPKTIRSK